MDKVLVRRPSAPRGLAAPQVYEADCGLSAAGAHVHPGATQGTGGCCRLSKCVRCGMSLDNKCRCACLSVSLWFRPVSS